MQIYKFTDTAISHIAKLLQMAILTGTDIIDNLRCVEMVSNDEGMLMIDPNSIENFDKNIQTMLDNVSTLEEDKGSANNVITLDLAKMNMSFGSDDDS